MGVFAMPSLGADMEAGTLVEWMIGPGDEVRRGDVVAVVETQKGAIEIEIFEDGVVDSLTAKVGQTLPVGAPLAVVLRPGETAPPVAPVAPAPEPAPEPAPRHDAETARAAAPPPEPASPTGPAIVPPPPATAPGTPPPASPAARAYAVQEGIDLSSITGSGPGGVILLADVAGRGAPRPTAAKPESPMAAMRAAIAAAMTRSKREIPHYYLMHSVDVQAATDWLEAQNATRGPQDRLLMGALFVKAAAMAAKRSKGINGHYADDKFHSADAVHAGVAVALRGGGLVAPAIHDADTLPLDDLMAAMRDVVFRARAGRLRSSEMRDGTITVSSLGEKGVEAMEGVIYPPQVALVGVGTPLSRPWVVDGRAVPRMVATLSLAADHRASDGRLGARFLLDVETLLQTPEAL